jgi:hypothetical protein
VFESAVDRFGRAVGRAGAVEVGEHVGLSKFVVRSATASDAPRALEEFLDRFAAEMLPLQN